MTLINTDQAIAAVKNLLKSTDYTIRRAEVFDSRMVVVHIAYPHADHIGSGHEAIVFDRLSGQLLRRGGK